MNSVAFFFILCGLRAAFKKKILLSKEVPETPSALILPPWGLAIPLPSLHNKRLRSLSADSSFSAIWVGLFKDKD